jgi:hypothetical protein
MLKGSLASFAQRYVRQVDWDTTETDRLTELMAENLSKVATIYEDLGLLEKNYGPAVVEGLMALAKGDPAVVQRAIDRVAKQPTPQATEGAIYAKALMDEIVKIMKELGR